MRETVHVLKRLVQRQPATHGLARLKTIGDLINQIMYISHRTEGQKLPTRSQLLMIRFLRTLACKPSESIGTESNRSGIKRVAKASLDSAVSHSIPTGDWDSACLLLNQATLPCLKEMRDKADTPRKIELLETLNHRKELPRLGQKGLANQEDLAIELLRCLAISQFWDDTIELDAAWSTAEDVSRMSLQYHKDAKLRQEDYGIVVDMILQFTTQESALGRKIARWCFDLVAENLDIEALSAMTDVLGQREDISGKNELEEANAEEESDTDPSDIEDGQDEPSEPSSAEVDSDVEELSQSGEDERETVDDEAASEAESEDSELLRFNNALGSTLGTTNQADSDAESEEPMDDEQMMELEPQLAQIFRERLGKGASHTQKGRKRGGVKKQEHLAAKRNIGVFKNRILDMLESLLMKHPSKPVTLGLSLPLLGLTRTSKR